MASIRWLKFAHLEISYRLFKVRMWMMAQNGNKNKKRERLKNYDPKLSKTLIFGHFRSNMEKTKSFIEIDSEWSKPYFKTTILISKYNCLTSFAFSQESGTWHFFKNERGQSKKWQNLIFQLNFLDWNRFKMI